MKIMLLRDVYKLGEAGDVKKVADGYARNYLLPRRLAVPAREGAHGMVKRAQAAGVKMREQEAKDKAGLAEKLGNLRVTVPLKRAIAMPIRNPFPSIEPIISCVTI